VTLMNLDAGEREDESAELWQLFDIVTIACGGHTGDRASMERVVAGCTRQLGAHPSYPDREQFGRVTMAMPIAALVEAIEHQCTALARVAALTGRNVEWVKPHGALYHDAARDPASADAVVRGARAALGDDVGFIGTARLGGTFLREGFADRAMRPDGSLVPRSEPGALITDPAAAAAQAKRLVGQVDTICVHGDTPGALAIARAVRDAIS
jgi:5-oxoprolinase (ATP-hydrolysing) subunit A